MSDQKTTIKDFYEKGTYLGYIEWEGCEVYPVIKHQKLEMPLCAFSSDLSVRLSEGGILGYSKDHPEDEGKILTLDNSLFDGIYKGELIPNTETSFIISCYAEKIGEDDAKEKSIIIDTPDIDRNFKENEVRYIPETLKDAGVISPSAVRFLGQIVAETDQDFIVDTGAYVFIDKRKKENEDTYEYNLGDWVSGETGTINPV